MYFTVGTVLVFGLNTKHENRPHIKFEKYRITLYGWFSWDGRLEEVMNKKEGLLAIALVLALIGFFVWYGSGSKSMNGQSGNWSGNYVGHEDNGVIFREFTLSYNGEDNLEETAVSYELNAKNGFMQNEVHLRGTKRPSNNKVMINTFCSDCRVAIKSEEIKIHIEWNGKEEDIVLKD